VRSCRRQGHAPDSAGAAGAIASVKCASPQFDRTGCAPILAEPGGIFIDVRDTVYVADSLLSPQTNAGWIRGIRIGNARDGAVSAFIPDATPEANPITAAEGVAVDAQGNIYGAVVPTPGLLRYVRK
jgi:hypothetical protein